MTALATHIEAFLREHLLRHRGASPHTCDSYAYSFRALFTFAAQRLRTAPIALTLDQLDAALIGAFLEQLETTRRNGAATRNVRLAATGLLPVSAAPRAGRPRSDSPRLGDSVQAARYPARALPDARRGAGRLECAQSDDPSGDPRPRNAPPHHLRRAPRL